jgi:hypothetical protein
MEQTGRHPMTKDDYNDHIAEKVMGWKECGIDDNRGTVWKESYHSFHWDYNPYDNDEQAIEALREWCKNTGGYYCMAGDHTNTAIELASKKAGHIALATDPELSVAIVKALTQATKEAE